MALVSLAGVVLYLIGIPSLFFYKLFSNRAYTIFTKSLSMLSEQVETGEERPEKAVQRMLELADQFSRKLGKKKLRCAVCDQLNEDTARACAHCGAEAVSQCINCKLVAYCSRKCQKRHWRDHHKGRCFSPSERAAFRTPATAAQLWHASWRGEEAAVLDLSMHGANVNHFNTKVGCNALFIAAQEGHDAVVRALLDAGADKEIARNDGTTALFIAAQVGHDACVRALLDAGADTDHALNRTTPLYIAAFHGHEVIVRALLDAGADKDRPSKDGATPLYAAAVHGHEACVRALLDAGADKDRATNDGNTPLFIAAQDGHDAIARALLDTGADIDLADKESATPLYIAVQNGHGTIARALLDAGADKDRAMKNGLTPLIFASGTGQIDLARALLSAGADTRKTYLGKTALEHARTAEMRELLG